jgi:site-specific DNA recombinase
MRRITPPILPRVAALYCRVSSAAQAANDKTSLHTQLAALQAKAAELGHTTSSEWTYQDTHSGEELHQRPALSRLREDARAGRFGLVLAYNVYALAKNQAHIAILLDEWEHLGIGLQFVTEELENTPLGRLILNARTFAAKVEGERRRDRMQRALLAQVQSGRMAPSARAPYGYQWPDGPDARMASGALRRDHLERNPVTWPIVERIWREALAGRTLRAIAAGLTADGIPTPSGRSTHWDPSVVRYLLNNPLYWGKPVALRLQLVPVAPSVRRHYARKSRLVTRPVEEQVPLPEDFAPAVVTPEQAARVLALLTLNQQLATPQNPDPQELLRGIAKCGYCRNGLLVARYRQPLADGTSAPRALYRCRRGNRIAGDCQHHSIEAHKLDAAVWAAVVDEFQHPERLEAEVERMRAIPDPGASTVEAIDRQIADVRRKIANKRKYAEAVDDDRERDEVAGEVADLRKQERALEAERAATCSHYADWQATQQGLARTVDYAQRVAGHLERFTPEQRRETLLTLKAGVWLYQADRTPRVEATITLPLSGTLRLPIDVDGTAGGMVCSTPS